MTQSSDRLLALLKEHSFRRGEFRLASGKQSDFFIDCKPVVLSAEGHVLVGRALEAAARAISDDAVAVAGVELGGCSLASAVATLSFDTERALNAIYVRKSAKDHGTQKLLEGSELVPKGSSVVILEDTVTTGGSTKRAIEKINAAGYRVAGVVAVVDRLEGGAQAITELGIPFVALYTRDDFMGAA